MKIIQFIFTLTLFSFLASNAQITKGNWMVGGNLTLSNNESESTNGSNTQTFKASRFNINGSVGYFPIDKLVVGLSPSFSWSNPEGSQ